MSTIELSDIDGDAVTVTRQGDSTWITCTSGGEEVTVGPFSPRLLRSVLAAGTLEDHGDGTEQVTVAAREHADGSLEVHTTWGRGSA